MNSADLPSLALGLTGYGMLVVFVFLSLLVLCTSLMSALARRFGAPPVEAETPAGAGDDAAATAAAAAASHHHRRDA